MSKPQYQRYLEEIAEAEVMQGQQSQISKDAYWNQIAALPCIICKREGETEVCHVRHGTGAGMGLKSDYPWVFPLCHEHHRTGPDAQHNMGETQWAERWGIDLKVVAAALWDLRHNPEMQWNYVFMQEVKQP